MIGLDKTMLRQSVIRQPNIGAISANRIRQSEYFYSRRFTHGVLATWQADQTRCWSVPLEARVDAVESSRQDVTDIGQRGDDHDRDEAGDQSIFDSSRARLVLDISRADGLHCKLRIQVVARHALSKLIVTTLYIGRLAKRLSEQEKRGELL